jgi:hypothetical protein
MNRHGQRPHQPAPPPPDDHQPRRRRQRPPATPTPVQVRHAAPPPDPPPQERSPPCRGEERDRGQKLPTQAAVFAAPTTPRAREHARSIDPRKHTSHSSPTPPKTSPGRGSSSSTKTPNKHRHPPLAGALGEPTPTIYTPRTQNQGSPTLPPPERQAERRGTTGLAGGGTRNFGSPPYRLGEDNGTPFLCTRYMRSQVARRFSTRKMANLWSLGQGTRPAHAADRGSRQRVL